MTDETFDHVVVFGAGAIGSLYGAKIAAQRDVLMVGRPDHVEAIERKGLRVIGKETFTRRLRAASSVPPLAARTLVLLTTKVNDNARAAAAMADAVRDDTVVLCVQNGLHGEAIVKETLGSRCLVLRAITQCGAIFREPGLVDFKIGGETYVEASPRSGAIADLLSASGLDGRVCGAIATEVWRKLIFNCVINPVTSITGGEVGSIADGRLDPIKRLIIDECLQVARADGVTFEIDFIAALARVFGPSRNTASMRQDLMKGKPTEIEHMNGAVVALGRTHGIDCPVNAALVTIIKGLERQGLGVRD